MPSFRRLMAALAAVLFAGTAFAQTREELAQIANEFGGVYRDEELQRYVSSIGELIASASDNPRAIKSFTVLDSDVINAFAVPSGDIFITRGLIALANSEAELASVLAHEAGHVTAEHASGRQRQSLIYQALPAIAGALLGAPELGQLGSMLGGLRVQSYSREQEFESDTLAIKFMGRAGYDQRAAAWVLQSLQDKTALDARVAGAPRGDDSFNMLSSHPRTVDRVERAIQASQERPARQPMLARDIYLKKIDGILWGDNPDQGVVRNRVFLHPALRFAFEVPDGFHLANGTSQVQARGPNGAVIVFDQSKQPFSGAPEEYLARVWAAKAQLAGLQRLDINGLPAATATTQAQLQGQTVDVRFVAIRWDAQRFYRFIFAAPPNVSRSLDRAFERTAYSFRRISERDAASVRPLRVRVVTARPGDTLETFVRQMQVDRLPREELIVLNGMPNEYQIKPGDQVKIVTDR